MSQFSFQKNKFFAPISFEARLSRAQRHLIAAGNSIGIVMLALLLVYTQIQHQLSNLPRFDIDARKIIGILFLLFAVRIFIFLINRFISSTTFDKQGEIFLSDPLQRLNYFAAQLWFYGVYIKNSTTLLHVLTSLAQTELGAHLLVRLGITQKEWEDFLAGHGRETSLPINELIARFAAKEQDRDITAGDPLCFVYNQDKDFRDFLTTKLVDEKALAGTVQWIEQNITRDDQEKRWWSREKLGRIPGLAKSWAYGPVFTLMQFAARVSHDAMRATPLALIGRENEIKLIESILLAQANANVIIVGDPGAGKETIVLGLMQMIFQGKIFPELESKRVFQLAGPSVVAAGKTKGETEAILIKIFNEAAYAGDVILVIEQFPEFVESLENLGIVAAQILEPYLRSNELHIIAMADTFAFRKFVESNAAIMAHFEKVEILEPDEAHLLLVLRDAAPRIETQARGSVIFSYPALQKIAEAGIRYLVEGALPERAITLMQELVNYGAVKRIALIGPELVAEYIGKKTKIPLGAITKEEQSKLMNLEDRLHERVINQVEAINAIANAIRRSRAGIGEPKRPIGSFLFLGPTGVGKTETAKALAFVYFGNEEMMMRFDMTEYQTQDALERLIGAFDTNEPGILASTMRSSPYGAILLDEFEKADKKVIDLFLQILDEGFFSDAFGKQVNMRNTIIMATSNASAQLIWRFVEDGIDPSTKKSEIIAQIQQEGKFKPELLNRFDAIIIFQPLSQEHLKQVARLMLKKLAARLKEDQHIMLDINDELIDEMVRQGYDPTFGARPMRRFIQDKIEKVIAEKIIKGELQRGGSLTLTARDL